MFTINPNITDLKVKERNIYKILYSMNSPQVATPELSVEEARCYVLFFSEGPNLSAYIGLYLPRTDRKIFYAYSSNAFPFEAAADVEAEATTFAEDMGFLLDEISVSGMQPDDRNRWIEEQFLFGYRKPEVIEAEAEGAGPEGKAKAEAESGTKTKGKARSKGEAKKEVPEIPKEPEHGAPPVQGAVVEPVRAAPAAPPAAAPQAAPAPYPPYPQPLQQQAQPVAPAYPPMQPPQPFQPPYPPQVPQPGQPYAQQPYGQPQQQPYPPQQVPQPGQPYVQQPYVQAPQPVYPQQQGQTAEPQYPPVQQPPQQIVPPQPTARGPQGAPPLQRPQPAPQPGRKKPPVQKAVQRPAHEEVHEEEVPVEVDLETAYQRPPTLLEEAVKEGVIKQPKPKPQKTVRSATGVVARDKEALARLLASF